jgi:hypothetical protein
VKGMYLQVLTNLENTLTLTISPLYRVGSFIRFASNYFLYLLYLSLRRSTSTVVGSYSLIASLI